MVKKGRQNTTDSPKAEVGEIDTSAPFQSVKDAVTLFGEVAFSGEKFFIKRCKPHYAERVLAKETQLHLTEKELNKLKEQLKNAESTKVQALLELESAKRTLHDLSDKLKSVNVSKELVIKITEAAKNQAKQLDGANSGKGTGSSGDRKQDLENATSIGDRKQDLENAREKYTVVFKELDAAKQELRKIRQDCMTTSEEKVAANNQAAEAEQAAKLNMERVSELSKEISVVQESVGEVKLASSLAQQEQAKIFSEKDVQRQSYKATMDESSIRLSQLRTEFDPEAAKNLKSQLAERVNQIGSLQRQMENEKASDMNSVSIVSAELDDAKDSLQKVAVEGNSVNRLVESLKRQLEKVRKEHCEVTEKEAEMESLAGSLHVQLRKSKSELEACVAEESKASGASEEMILTLNQLTCETEDAQREAEEMKNKAEELKKEAGATKSAREEAEYRLKANLEEAEEAKAAEARALDQINTLTERTNAARASTSEDGAQITITISREEFESLSRKVEASKTLADMKVAAAIAQVDAVKASETEASKKLDAKEKEIEDMKIATQQALKRAEMAEAAKRAVEGELRRWREREQKKATEAASRILAETESSIKTPPPHNFRVQKQNNNHNQLDKTIETTRKLEKEKNSVSKKVLLPNISGIFHRKKNQVDGGSPSFQPGEKLV